MITINGLAMDDDFVRRMRNWARSALGNGFGTVKAMDYGAVHTGGYREASMPVLTGEADDTERALAAVPIRYRQAVIMFWQYEGRSWVLHGQNRGVTDKTFKAWVRLGHALLRAELVRRSAIVRHDNSRRMAVSLQG